MAFDLLIKNGRIIDGSGMPSFRGDVAVRAGKIVELGKLSGAAARVIDADGLVVAPGTRSMAAHKEQQRSSAEQRRAVTTTSLPR